MFVAECFVACYPGSGLDAQIERKEKTNVPGPTLNEKHHGWTKYRPRFEKIMIPLWMHLPPTTSHSSYSGFQDDGPDGIDILKQCN